MGNAMRRAALLGLILALVGIVLLGAVSMDAAATPTPSNETTATATATVSPSPTPVEADPDVREKVEDIRDGPYSIVELRKDGDVPPGSGVPKAARALGNPPRGFVGARYRDPTLIDALTGSQGAWQQIGPTKLVQQDRVQLYGSAFGDVAGDYELVIVYWQVDHARVNNNTVPYAANQTIDTQTVTVGGGQNLYTFTNVSLRQHVDATWKVTMWLERGGEKVDGVQWHFKHRSNPAQEAAPAIGSKADLWAWGIGNIGLPGIVGVIVGLVGSRVTLRRTARGPGYGIKSWILILFFVGLFVAMIAYYQIAVILQHFPQVIGISIGIVAYAAGLTIHPEEKKIGFLRRELFDAVTVPGDSAILQSRATDGGALDVDDAGAEAFEELTEAIKLDLPEVPAVRTQDGYKIPTEGVKSFFARLFADAATLNLEGVATRQTVNDGRLDEIIVVDPKSNQAVEHKPAKIKRMLPWDSMKYDAEETGEQPTVYEKTFAAVLSGVIVVGPPLAGMALADHLLNLPSVGFLIGLVGTAIIAYTSEDGWIDYVPAPPMYKRAEDSLTMLQKALSWSAEEESARKALYRERATTASEAREQQTEERKTVTDRILERLGADREDGRPQLTDDEDR